MQWNLLGLPVVCENSAVKKVSDTVFAPIIRADVTDPDDG